MDGNPASKQAAIGILDSGVGGLSVLRAIHHLLPHHPTIYFADQKHLPYGSRDAAQIRHFVRGITGFLLEQGATIIVIACNAASAASLYELRQEFADVPFVGMEPAVKPAAESTRTGVIGVLTTQATADGPLYQRVVERYARNVRIITQVAPELVTIVEAQSQDTAEAQAIIRDYVTPITAAGADQIALACTHFPFLMDTIQTMVGPAVHLIDPGPAIARQVARMLPESAPHQDRPTNHGENRYVTSGSPEHFRQALRTLIGVDAPVMAY